MNPRQNLLAALSHAEVEWIPWVPYIGGVNTPIFTPEDIKRRQDFVEIGLFLQDYLGCDILIDGAALRLGRQTALLNRTADGNQIVEYFTIAGRTLRRVHKTFMYGDQGTSAIAEYPVKTTLDMETLGWLFQDQTIEADGQDFLDKTRRLGDRGVVYANGPRTPMMALIIDYMGLEAFLEALADQPQETEQLMATMHEANLAVYRALAKTECAVIGTFDDFDTCLISPAMYQRYVGPYLKQYSEIVHLAGKRHMVHSCGHVRAFLKMCLETGYDAHNYLTPPPTGNTPLAEARAIWGDRISIMAAVDPVLIEMGAEDDVAQNVRRMLADAASTRSFIVMTSSKPTVPEANLRAVASVLKESRICPAS